MVLQGIVDRTFSNALNDTVGNLTGGAIPNASNLASIANAISSGNVLGAMQGLTNVDSLGLNNPNAQTALSALSAVATGNPMAVAGFAMNALGIDPLGEVANALGLGGLKDGIENAIDAAKEGISEGLGNAIDGAKDALGDIGNAIGDAAGSIGDAIGDAVGSIGDAIGDVADAVGDALGGNDASSDASGKGDTGDAGDTNGSDNDGNDSGGDNSGGDT